MIREAVHHNVTGAKTAFPSERRPVRFGGCSGISEYNLAMFQKYLDANESTLFPACFVIASQRYDPSFENGLLSNGHNIESATMARRREFAAGRTCAHTAIRRLGGASTHVPVGIHREPLWPRGFIGSITHAAGLALAVVALRENASAVGIDLEPVGSLGERLWGDVLNPSEIEWLRRQPRPQQSKIATTIFCAKESFYKLVYPAAQMWVDFHQAEVSLDVEKGEYRLCCNLSELEKRFGTSDFVGRHISMFDLTFTFMQLRP